MNKNDDPFDLDDAAAGFRKEVAAEARRTRAALQTRRKFTPRADALQPLARECLVLGARLALACDRLTRGRSLENFDASIAEILGWPEEMVCSLTARHKTAVRRALRARLKDLTRPGLPQHPLLDRNLATLSARLGLAEVDCALLKLAVLLGLHRVTYQMADSIYIQSPQFLKELLSNVTGLPQGSIEKSLREDAVLPRTGLLSVKKGMSGHSDLNDRLDLLGDFAQDLLEVDFAAQAVRGPHLLPMPQARQELAHYPHLTKETALIRTILVSALANRCPGVNILLHGAPGTGKTELARALVHAAGAKGLELRNPPPREETPSDWRLRMFSFSQRLLSSESGQIVLFDEVEDVLASEGDWGLFMFGASQSITPKKGWKISVLESNAVPTIWTCNSIWRIDPALQRRFTYCLEVPVPPRSVRLEMLKRITAPGPEAATLFDKIADDDHLTPADVERVNRVLSLCRPENVDEWRKQVVLTLGARPDGVDASALLGSNTSGLIRYETKWINASPALTEVAGRLNATGEGRLCFAGPPGTGKTAFARHLAKQLDRPLLSKKASDLLSPYVGGTEQKLARAFKEARTDNAVLLIDEADSFLQNRQAAHRSWEITQVNEVLKQLEEHTGYVILSTNLYDHLDPAVMRRLDVKVSFGYLDPLHLPEVFAAAGAGMGLPDAELASFAVAADWRQLADLAIGDVAAAMRQVRLTTGAPTPAALFRALREQLAHRNRLQGRPIGF